MKLFLFLLLTPMALFAQNFILVENTAFATDSTNTNGASFVDIDNDGDLDIFLSNAQNPFGANTTYINEGDDNFIKIEAGELTGMQTPTFGNSWADYDNDGDQDVFVVNGFTKLGSFLYTNLGNLKFSRNESYNQYNADVRGFNADFADYDNDGYLDIVVSHPAKFVGMPITGNFLFHNEGNGTFTEVKNTPITAFSAPFTNASWVDFDLDGDQDLFIGSGPANGTLAPDKHFRNMLKETGKITFQSMRKELFATDSLDGQVWNWVDYDNDGDLDAYVTNWGGIQKGLANSFYENTELGYIKADKGNLTSDKYISLANVWADFDNDGDLDCYVGNGGNQTNNYYQNNGDGSFKKIEVGHFVEATKNTWGVTVGDYDDDGDIDLFVSNKTQYVSGKGDINFLYRNDLKNNNDWIKFELEGTKSNRDGIGAILYLNSKNELGELIQVRQLGANDTFLGVNDKRVHFGLGENAEIENLIVKWPSGEVNNITDIKINRIYRVVEGQSK